MIATLRGSGAHQQGLWMAAANAVNLMDSSIGDAPVLNGSGGFTLIRIFRRRLGLIATISAAALGLALIYLFFATRLFTASSVILLEPRSPLSQSDVARYSLAADSALMDSQIRLLTSDAVLRRVIDRENLQDDPEFGSPRADALSFLARLFGTAKSEAEQRVEAAASAAYALSQAVSVKRPERTFVMEASVTARDPDKAARLANALAEAYIADQAMARADSSKRGRDLLEANIDQLRQKIEKAEAAVDAYKAKNRIAGPSSKTSIDQMHAEMASARAKTAEAKARYDQARQAASSGRSIEALPEALNSPAIDKLRVQNAEIVRLEANARTTLGDLHPQYREIQQRLRDTRRLIAEELARVVETARSGLRAAEANEGNIARQLEQLKSGPAGASQTNLRLRELEREVEANKAVLDNLLSAKGDAARDSLDMPAARVIAKAAPPATPSSPQRSPILILATTIGLGLGLAAAIALERGAAEPRQTTVASSWRVITLPSPAQPAERAAIFSEIAADAPKASSEGGPTTCLFLDLGAADGHLLALEFARAWADAGRSTLVVEMSARAGELARALRCDLPIGIVALGAGENAMGVIASDDGDPLLVVAPGAIGQRRLAAPLSAGPRDIRRFDAQKDFALALAYAKGVGASECERLAARSDMIVVAVASDRRPTSAQRKLIETLAAMGAPLTILTASEISADVEDVA